MAVHAGFVVSGILLLIAMLTLHGICLSWPYYVKATDLGKYLSNKTDLSTYRAYYPNMNVNVGFWKMCFNKYGRNGCYFFDLDEDVNSNTIKAPDWMIACQAVSIIGLIIGALGVVFPLVWLGISSNHLLVAGSVSAISGGIIIIIADIVFATKKSVKFAFLNSLLNPTFGTPEDKYMVAVEDAFQYDWNFGLDLATGIASVLIGVFFAICASLTKTGQIYISKTII